MAYGIFKLIVMYCEICGRPITKGYLVRIEGAVLLACESCAERGEIIQEVREKSGRKVFKEESYTDLVDDFGKRIREARKRLRMDLKELSRETGISVKALKLMEEEKIIPTEEQARKLEKALGIKLLEEEEDVELRKSDDFTLTLGDVVRIR